MEDLKKEKNEYDIDNSLADAESYNRKNVDAIKRAIVVAFCLLCMVPVFLCIHLAGKLSSMDKQVEELEKAIDEKEAVIYELSEQNEDIMSDDELLALDEAASDDIEKNTTEDGGVLSAAESDTRHLNGKKVYLTFDDGPSIYTDEILEILREKGVKATFFVVYTEDEDLWDEYSSIVEDGHTLGMHSYTHMYDVMYKDLAAFRYDVTMIHDFIYEQTGVDSTYYRFPGGSSNTVSRVDMQLLMEYLYEEGYTYYDWNSLSGDAVDAYLSPEQLNANVMGYVRNNPGDSIVLMHDLKNNYNTVEALPELIDTLIEEGYEICPIDEYTEPVQHVTYIIEE